ncbi:MAG: helix-turn-helix transcriptional regulator, partial [Gemmatimonadales bacterium]
MATTTWDTRFLATSRGQIVGLLRREGQTVEALSRALGLTTNAIRGHLAILERDGMVAAGGRRASGGKPAQVYILTAAAEARLSRAHAPVLRSLLDELASRTPPAEMKELLRASGHRLATTRAADGSTLQARIAAAQQVLADLGGVTEVAREGGTT